MGAVGIVVSDFVSSRDLSSVTAENGEILVRRFVVPSPHQYNLYPDISRNGRFISYAGGDPLIPGNRNTLVTHVYIYDRLTGETHRISEDDEDNPEQKFLRLHTRFSGAGGDRPFVNYIREQWNLGNFSEPERAVQIATAGIDSEGRRMGSPHITPTRSPVYFLSMTSNQSHWVFQEVQDDGRTCYQV